MDAEFCLEDNRTWVSPVLGSSISPLSPATLDLRDTETSAAATSSWEIHHIVSDFQFPNDMRMVLCIQFLSIYENATHKIFFRIASLVRIDWILSE